MKYITNNSSINEQLYPLINEKMPKFNQTRAKFIDKVQLYTNNELWLAPFDETFITQYLRNYVK